jgi:hypothetical protein
MSCEGKSPNQVRREELTEKYSLPVDTGWAVIAGYICEDFRRELAREFGLSGDAPWSTINRYR